MHNFNLLRSKKQNKAKTTVLSMKLPAHCFLASTLKSLVRLTVLLLVVSSNKTKGAVKLPPNISVPAVLVFGDSIMDTGNNNNNLITSARSNFPPYGQDFKGGIPTGRFCNGKVPSDILGLLASRTLINWFFLYIKLNEI